jgi:hypothetical protein
MSALDAGENTCTYVRPEREQAASGAIRQKGRFLCLHSKIQADPTLCT